MKTCPKCNQVYKDETYSFCLEDGTLLTASYDPQATIDDTQAALYDPPATIKMPAAFDNLPPTVFVPSDFVPTEQLQPEDPQSDIIGRLLNYLEDKRQQFSTLGRFRFKNEYIWTNGHFFEIAESIPTVLTDVFPLKESSNPVELIKSLQTQLTSTYTKVQSIVPSKQEGLIDLISDKHTIQVKNIYYQYLHIRYPRAAVMLGESPFNPALFVLDGKLRAGIMGFKL